MSMYHLVCDPNPAAGLLLFSIDLHFNKIPRLRDVYMSADGTRVFVFARIGAGNRAAHQTAIDALRKHPCYISDADDSFDNTYATFEFKTPEDEISKVGTLAKMLPHHLVPPMERMKQVLNAMQNNPDSPEAKRAIEAGKKAFGPMLEKLIGETKKPQ